MDSRAYSVETKQLTVEIENDSLLWEERKCFNSFKQTLIIVFSIFQINLTSDTHPLVIKESIHLIYEKILDLSINLNFFELNLISTPKRLTFLNIHTKHLDLNSGPFFLFKVLESIVYKYIYVYTIIKKSFTSSLKKKKGIESSYNTKLWIFPFYIIII